MDSRLATPSDGITQDEEIMVGKPVIAGTRIPVERVLSHLAQNPDLPDLFAAYPELTVDDVKTCLRFAREAVRQLTRVQSTNVTESALSARS